MVYVPQCGMYVPQWRMYVPQWRTYVPQCGIYLNSPFYPNSLPLSLYISIEQDDTFTTVIHKNLK